MKYNFKNNMWMLISVMALGQVAYAANCQVPGAPGASLRQDQNISGCMNEANYLVDAPDMTNPEIAQQLVNPQQNKVNVNNGDSIYCRYNYQRQGGQSAKFRCALTNANNQLYDSEGNLVPEARTLKAVGDEVYLADERGNILNNAKAEILKIRYYNGDSRNVENYVSTAVSRVLWLLGVPAHTNIMTSSVTCFGCGNNPFRQTQVEADRRNRYVVTTFRDASIEVKFKGKRIYEPDDKPWAWTDLMGLVRNRSVESAKSIEIEVFALASQFLGYISDQSFQNAVVCTEINANLPYICDKVVFMTHDIGAGLGKRYGGRSGLFGTGSRPRGDLREFESAQVFQPGTCNFMYQSGDSVPRTVSRAARDEFMRRAANLTEQNLMTLYRASHIGNLSASNAQAAESNNARWTQATLRKLQEIASAPCN